MEEVMIRMENAVAGYKNFSMKPVNLELPRGFIIGIQGPNGSGKSTLLKMILGNFKDMQGNVWMDGMDVRRQRSVFFEKIGVINSEREFFEEEDAVKNEAHFSDCYPDWDGEEYRRMLKKLGISKERSIRTLSAGERIKFQLAFSAAYRPKLMVLDEPTAGLDPVFRDDFLKILQDFVAEYETTVLLATHLDEDLDKVADYIIDVENGACTLREAGYQDGVRGRLGNGI